MPFLRHTSNAITPIIARQFLSIFMYDLSKNIANPTKIIKISTDENVDMLVQNTFSSQAFVQEFPSEHTKKIKPI